MKKLLYSFLLASLFLLGFSSYPVVHAERVSISDLPFSGFYIAPEENGILGLLFEDNQLYIYINDDSRYDHGDSYHNHAFDDHQHHDEDEHHHAEGEHQEIDRAPDHDFIEWLFELNSFPHPDLQNYTDNVRNVYLEEYDLAYDLKDTYAKITEKITPEMSQSDILQMMNNYIPGIDYTEREGFMYFTIASPTVSETHNGWNINLFGNDLFTFKVDGRNLIDVTGTEYEYIDGIKPN